MHWYIRVTDLLFLVIYITDRREDIVAVSVCAILATSVVYPDALKTADNFQHLFHFGRATVLLTNTFHSSTQHAIQYNSGAQSELLCFASMFHY